MSSDNLCAIVALAVSLVCAIYGFMDMLKKQHMNESELGVIQRQVRGLGYLILAPVLLSLGLGLCHVTGMLKMKL
jgi:hypothetical protein